MARSSLLTILQNVTGKAQNYAGAIMASGENPDGTAYTLPTDTPTGAQVDGHSASIGATTDAEATGNGSVIALLKRLRTLLSGGLPAALSALGNLKTAVLEIPTVGTQGNAWSAVAVGAGGTSAAIDTQNCSQLSVFGNVSGATTLTVQFSQDNVNFYDSGTTTAPSANFGINVSVGARYIRLKSSAAVTITATIAGKN